VQIQGEWGLRKTYTRPLPCTRMGPLEAAAPFFLRKQESRMRQDQSRFSASGQSRAVAEPWLDPGSSPGRRTSGGEDEIAAGKAKRPSGMTHGRLGRGE
jgi:hypothetical protein